jgi:energy-coupling factor transporter ATPase
VNRQSRFAKLFLKYADRSHKLSRSAAENIKEAIRVMELIHIEDLYYSYEHQEAGDESERSFALRGIDLAVESGEYVAIVGANGSGKSTLLRHLNALLVPTRGDVWISGHNTKDPSALRQIRSRVGIVFQNPDTQLITTLVEDEVSFGPENLGLPEDEIDRRVDWAMASAGVTGLKSRPPHLLSAGQKQLVAIASVLAMRPDCLVLDEATSMLDPASKKSVLDTVRKLHLEGMTVVLATHSMEEAACDGRIVVLSEGKVAIDGDPYTVFSRERMLREMRLDLPCTVRIARGMDRRLFRKPSRLSTVETLVRAVLSARDERSSEGEC